MARSQTVAALPKTQYAVQLIGPSRLALNKRKAVPRPGPHQVLAKIEAVGLCFSDLKLLKQFSAHPRKAAIVSGISPDVLAEIPSYVPGEMPTVPGHEATGRIAAVGNKVSRHKVGERCLIQTDYRGLRTAGSNAAFGYNFEGALQQYVLMDERVVIDPATGDRFLIPVPEDQSASAIALVEPWACVEDSYVTVERRTLAAGGRLLIVSDGGSVRAEPPGLPYAPEGRPAQVTVGVPADAAKVPNESLDDILYFGADPSVLETLNDKIAPRGILNIVLGGRRIGRPVSVGVGRVHYGMTRWIGTAGVDAAASYAAIPATGEIRPGDRMMVVGAGGPMGQMHVIRAICSGVKDLHIVAADVDDARLESLGKKARPMAAANQVDLRLVNTAKAPPAGTFSYIALMAPVGALVADAVSRSAPGCLINVFAGIPAPTRQKLDLDTYIANRCFLFGTSGSVIRDMKIVLEKVVSGQLNTDCSVDAVSGMAGAVEGIAAVENRTLAGKIVVYPMLREMGLIPLADMARHFPSVASRLQDGQWCRAAEEELLKAARAAR
jgi:threonine dehydrogenase-like Zn-dependent dehydrogenase